MSLLGALKQWGNWGWGKKDTATAIAKSTAKSSYIIIASLFDQVAAIPKVANAIVNDPPTTKVAKHLARVLLVDMMQLLVVTYGADLFLKYFFPEPDTISDTPDAGWANSALKTSAELTARILFIRSLINFYGHTILIGLETPELSKFRQQSNLCATEKCSQLEIEKGVAKNIAAFFITEGTLSALEHLAPSLYLPIYLARIIDNGHYIYKSSHPSLCYKHNQRNLREHSELAFSLGLGHSLMVSLISALLEQSGVPSRYYSFMISSVLLFWQISAANHMIHPEPKPTTKRLPDPLIAHEMFVLFLIATFLLGLKKQIPHLMAPSPGSLTIRDVASTIHETISLKAIGNAIVVTMRPIGFITLPRQFQDLKAFANDPIVRSNWEIWQKNAVAYLTLIEDSKYSFTGKMIRLTADLIAFGVELSVGVPSTITAPSLKATENNDVNEFIHQLRVRIQSINLRPAPPVIVNEDAIRLSGYVPPTTKKTASNDTTSPSSKQKAIRVPPKNRSSTAEEQVNSTSHLRNRFNLQADAGEFADFVDVGEVDETADWEVVETTAASRPRNLRPY